MRDLLGLSRVRLEFNEKAFGRSSSVRSNGPRPPRDSRILETASGRSYRLHGAITSGANQRHRQRSQSSQYLVEDVDRLSDLEAPHQGFEQSGHLQAGEMHAGAHVRAIAESQVIRGSPLHIEAFRFCHLRSSRLADASERRQKKTICRSPVISFKRCIRT